MQATSWHIEDIEYAAKINKVDAIAVHHLDVTRPEIVQELEAVGLNVCIEGWGPKRENKKLTDFGTTLLAGCLV
jgi:hypothetical protein